MDTQRDCTDHYVAVCEFMKLAGQTVREVPAMPSLEERTLRARLILEEAIETIEALGIDVVISGQSAAPCTAWSRFLRKTEQASNRGDIALSFTASNKAPDLIEIADGCADIAVVTTGTLIACGIPDRPLMDLVNRNNLAKFGPGGRRNEATGKWEKPPGHRPPDVAGLLERLLRGK